MVQKLAERLGSWLNGLKAGRMAWKLAEWFESWSNGLKAGRMV